VSGRWSWHRPHKNPLWLRCALGTCSVHRYHVLYVHCMLRYIEQAGEAYGPLTVLTDAQSRRWEARNSRRQLASSVRPSVRPSVSLSAVWSGCAGGRRVTSGARCWTPDSVGRSGSLSVGEPSQPSSQVGSYSRRSLRSVTSCVIAS